MLCTISALENEQLKDRNDVLFTSVFRGPKPVLVGFDMRFSLYSNTRLGADSRVRTTRVVFLLLVCLRWGRRATPPRPSRFSFCMAGACGAPTPSAPGRLATHTWCAGHTAPTPACHTAGLCLCCCCTRRCCSGGGGTRPP